MAAARRKYLYFPDCIYQDRVGHTQSSIVAAILMSEEPPNVKVFSIFLAFYFDLSDAVDLWGG